MDKKQYSDKLTIANNLIGFLNEENKKLAAELEFANIKLAFQNEEKEKRALELIITNQELTFQNSEKEKRAEELLLANTELAFLNKEQQALFASIINSSEDAIISLSLEGIITSWNYGAEKIFGFKAHEIKGKSILTFIPPSFHDEEWNVLKNIREGKTVEHFYSNRLRKDGTLFYASITLSSIQNFKGEIVGASKIIRDISDIKLLEEDKKRQAKRFLLAAQSANMAIWDWDLENNIIIWDDTMYKLYGIHPNGFDSLYNRWILRLHPEDRQRVENDIQLAIENKKDYDCEFRIVWDDLSIHYVKATGIVERDDAGIARHMMGANLDVTEQKEKEQQKNSLLTTLEKSLNEIYIFDAKTLKFSFVNQGALLNIGYSEQEIKELTPLDINPEFSATSFNQLVNPLLTNEKEKIIFFTNHKRKNGSLYPVEIHLQFVTEGKNKRFLAVILDITERKKGEEGLRNAIEKAQESDARFKAYAKQSPIAIYTTDINGDCIYANETWLKMAAMQLEDALGKGWINALHPEDLKYVTDNWYKSIESNGEWNFEYRFLNSNKNIIWVNGSAKKLFNDKNEHIGYLGSNVNITERKKAESKLIESENYLRTILDNEPECVKVLNKKGELLSMNPAGLTMIEADNEQQVLGHRMSDLVKKEYQFGFNQLSKEVFKGNPGTFEFEITGLKGGRRWLETHAVPLKDITGKIVNLLGVTRDITERKKADEKIIESENRMRLATSSAGMGIWYWDNKNDNMVWDKKLYHIYDINESQLGSVYEGWLSRLHPEDRDRVNEVMQTAIADKKREYSSEFRIVWSDLSVHYIKGTGITEYDDNGNVIGMMGVNWDVTAEKEKELHLKLLESVITNTTDSVLITEAEPLDHPGPRILYVNDAFTKMTGYSSEEVIGKTPRILQGPKSDWVELKRLGEAIRRWETYEITTINYKKSGEEFWINFKLTPVANEKGWYTHWISIERDVTEQYKHLKTIEAQNKKLRDIAWTQSHIIRAPLARMLGLLNIMEIDSFKSDDLPDLMSHFKICLHELDDIIMEIVQKTHSLNLEPNPANSGI